MTSSWFFYPHLITMHGQPHIRFTTTCIAIRYYFACRGDSCAHSRGSDYRLRSQHSMTTACPSDWSLFLNPDHPDISLITHLPHLDHFLAFHLLLSHSISPPCPSTHFVFEGATFDTFLSRDWSGKERRSTFVGSPINPLKPNDHYMVVPHR